MINRSKLGLILSCGGALMASATASAVQTNDEPESLQRDTTSAKESRQVRRHRERQEAKMNRRASK